MPKGSHKGGAFERLICAWLSLWISHGKRRDIFYRSAMSGGRATVFLKKGEKLNRQAGDICAIDPLGCVLTDRFYFELKHYDNIRMPHYIFTGRGKIDEWWKDTRQKAAKFNRQPVLIMKGTGTPYLIMTRHTCVLNPRPVAMLRTGQLGLLKRTLKTEFPKS